jgi:hypothetical protein
LAKNRFFSVYAGSVEVRCQAGFNGGLEQHFVLEVFEMLNGSQVLVATNWSRDPTIRVTGKSQRANIHVRRIFRPFLLTLLRATQRDGEYK